MRFARTVTVGVLLVALSSLASRANARAIDPHAVAARYKQVARCTFVEAGCVDASSSLYDIWKKRAFPKFGDDGDALGGAEAGEGGSGAVGVGGTTAGGTTESGGTAEIGGVGGGDTSDSDTGGVAVGEGNTSDSDTGGVAVGGGDTSDSDTGGVAVGGGDTSDSGTSGAAADAGAPASEDGSADTSSSEGSQSTSDDQFPQGPASQPVIDIVARGYGSIGTVGDDPALTVVKVTAPSVNGPLDVLEVDTALDSIGVKWAINDLDTIANNPGKVPLRSILADTWQSYGGMSGKQMSDLKSVNYQVVINDNMVDAYPLAYQAAGQTFVNGARTPLTVTADTIEGSTYNILMGTTFGIGVQKMIAETAGLEGRTIYSIDLFPDGKIDVQFNF